MANTISQMAPKDMLSGIILIKRKKNISNYRKGKKNFFFQMTQISPITFFYARWVERRSHYILHLVIEEILFNHV